MVSKASEDFPLPLGPVTTVSFPSGRSRSMPLRLFWRAPRISTHPCLADALTLSFSPFLEPTGDNRFTRCGLQIFRRKYGDHPLPRAESPLLARASEGSSAGVRTSIARRDSCAASPIRLARRRLMTRKISRDWKPLFAIPQHSHSEARAFDWA